MQKLYYIRHGETADNASERWGFYDTPLSDTGRRQAAEAGIQARSDGLAFDAIIASPQPRAQETARVFASEVGFPADRIETMDLLAERRMGPLAGQSYDSFFTGDKVYADLDPVDGVETVQALQERAAEAYRRISGRPEHVILVVGHGAYGRAFRRVANGIPYTDEYVEDRPHDVIPNAILIDLSPITRVRRQAG